MLVRERKRLMSILRTLERAQKYIAQPDVLVCHKFRDASTTLHFVNRQGEICLSVCKETGSDLCSLATGINDLRKFLEPENGQT
jgi:hypothetical protein